MSHVTEKNDRLDTVIVGIDEVGRGSWAGPVVAGAVALASPLRGLRDSKQLTRLQREKLATKIYRKAASIGVGWASVAEIDGLGLTESIRLAMRRALSLITIDFDELIIDGNYNFLPEDPHAHALVKADASVPVVSAASIIAKVARDAWMINEAATQFPDYKFDRHVGYGTALHREMMRLHGVCDLHRRSFHPVRLALECTDRHA